VSVFWIGLITGMFGGRPGMISGAAGAMAVVLGVLMRDSCPLGKCDRHDQEEQLLMCVNIVGIIELVAGPVVALFVKIIPQISMIGFLYVHSDSQPIFMGLIPRQCAKPTV